MEFNEDSIQQELQSRGMLEVLHHGFKCYGETFRLADLALAGGGH